MIAVGRFGRARAIQLLHQALDFGGVMLAAPGAAPPCRRTIRRRRELGEFDAAHAQAGAAIVRGMRSTPGNAANARQASGWFGRGPACRVPGGCPGCRGRADRRAR